MKRNTPKGRWLRLLATKRFSLFQDPKEATTFEVSWKKVNGSYARRRFSADNVERAIERAPFVAGLEVEKPDGEGITLLNGFTETLNETKREWLHCASPKPFV